ncbi:MAG: hypothetical protein ACJ74J_18495 [Blastocatellia bacterium]
MRNHSKIPVRLFTFTAIAMMALIVLLANRQERASALSGRQKDQERQKAEIEKVQRNRAALPRAEYRAPEPQDPALRRIRKARDKRYGTIEPFESMPEDALGWDIVTHDPFEPQGLPVAESDLVTLGKITEAKGYVTENKSAAYSEYTAEIIEVFKGKTNLVGKQIITERVGANVVLPSGRTILVADANRGAPETGHRYVLFLKYSPEGEDYLIVTAYDLQDGRVMSIDRFPQCESFDGNEEAAFLDLVRSSVK